MNSKEKTKALVQAANKVSKFLCEQNSQALDTGKTPSASFPAEESKKIAALFTIEDYPLLREQYDSLVDACIWLKNEPLKITAINFLDQVYVQHPDIRPISPIINGLNGGYLSAKMAAFFKKHKKAIIDMGLKHTTISKLVSMHEKGCNRNIVTGETEEFTPEKIELLEELIEEFSSPEEAKQSATISDLPLINSLPFSEQAAIQGIEA